MIGKAAEYVSAMYPARQDQIGLAITVGSNIQIAPLAAPLLVIVSENRRPPHDSGVLERLELIAFLAVTFTVNAIAQAGKPPGSKAYARRQLNLPPH